MSQNHNLQSEEFKLVAYNRRGKTSRGLKPNERANSEEFEEFDAAKALRRLQTAREDLENSDLLSSTLASLREALQHLDNPEIEKLICIGLGNAYERLISRYQLTLLLILREKLNVQVIVTDPKFNDSDIKLFNLVDIQVFEENIEGRFQASSHQVTLFFLPHCSKNLTNNLLYANWGLNLTNCVIIANSFTKIVEDTSKLTLLRNAGYILRVWDYTIELPIINTFKYFDVFNDLGIHIFPAKRLQLITEDFWRNRSPPVYDSDTEFITNQLFNVEL